MASSNPEIKCMNVSTMHNENFLTLSTWHISVIIMLSYWKWKMLKLNTTRESGWNNFNGNNHTDWICFTWSKSLLSHNTHTLSLNSFIHDTSTHSKITRSSQNKACHKIKPTKNYYEPVKRHLFLYKYSWVLPIGEKMYAIPIE